MTNEIKATGRTNVTVLTMTNWKKKIAAIKESGEQVANGLLEKDQRLDVQILAPRELPGASSTPLAAALLDMDWKIETRREMAELARDILTKAFVVGSLSPSLPSVLATIVEGRGLFEHSIGEFFLLYGRFEQKHNTSNKQTKFKMKKLVKGDENLLKPYTERGKCKREPLPYAVRNILAHAGTNANTLDKDDLTKSIKLLRDWVK